MKGEQFSSVEQCYAQVPELPRQIELVGNYVYEEVTQAPGSVGRALGEYASRRAKMLRPACTLLAARVQSGADQVSDKIIRLAAAIEMLHMASLIHDDVVDRAATRRGQPALHERFGTRRAVLMGDFVFSRCFSIVAEYASPANAQMLAAAVARLIGSELDEADSGLEAREELDARRVHIPSVREYYRRVIGKTAMLFSLSFHVGASESTPSPDIATINRLRRVGYNVGLGFQIIDDILDLTGDPVRTGKPTGTDLAMGIVTLPVLLAAARLDGSARSDLLETIHEASEGRSVTSRIATIVRGSGALESARQRAAGITARAFRELERMNGKRNVEGVHALTGFLLHRSY